MSKWFGKIGYLTTEETVPGVWSETIVERSYSGDSSNLRTSWRPDSSKLNDDLSLDIQISIIADPFAYNNLSSIRYVTFMGSKWKVTGISPEFPRLNLTIGGVYNGPETNSAD